MDKPLDYVDLNARDYPNKEALVDSRSRLTFSQVKHKSDRLALAFTEIGLRKQQVVVFQLPNVVEYFIVRSALQKAGLVGAYMGMNMRYQEMEYICDKTKAVGVVIVAESRGFDYFAMTQEMKAKFPHLNYCFVVGDLVPEEAMSITEMIERPFEKEQAKDPFKKTRIKPGELSEIRMTSGTTGFPKLVNFFTRPRAPTRGGELSKRFKVTNEDIFAALAPLTGGGSGPPCKILAQSEGCKVVLVERFDAGEALKLIERERVTFASGVPAQLTMMVKHPDFDNYDLNSLRVFYYAGSTIPYSIAEEVEEKMGCRVVRLLGGLDLGFECTTSFDDPPIVRRTSIGKLITPRVKLKLIDEQGREVPQGKVGEILIKKEGRGVSYYKDDEATLKRLDADGWYHTGDLAKCDEQGNFYIMGRRKDLIIRGGQNIYPAEIEGVLITHPKVVDVAIVGMPDPIMGEKACAFVIIKPSTTLGFNEMTSFLIDKGMTKYKLPERLELVDSFPMSGDGQKVLKRELAERITAKLKLEGMVT